MKRRAGEWNGQGQASWAAMAEEVFSGMREWRVQHPRATFKEIETALDERLARMRARILGDVVLQSAARDVGVLEPAQRPRCPDCGGSLVVAGTEERRLVTTYEQQVTLGRTGMQCTACGRRVFPPG